MSQPRYDLDTLLVYVGSRPCSLTGAVVPPIHLAATFAQPEPGKPITTDYTRTDNPTRALLQETLAIAENGKYALAFSSGMGAIDAAMGLLKAGEHVIAVQDIYGGTYRYLSDILPMRGVEYTFVDVRDERAVRAATKPNTRMLWFESPTNPLMKLVDIDATVRLARELGLLTVIDNTFMSPYFQRPLEMGVDVVVHSMTKYLNGHSDVLMGAAMTNSDELHASMKYIQNAVGAVPSPFDCFLALRGIKTLALRMARHEENAIALAAFLEQHPRIKEVMYPGLPSSPDHELAQRQASGFGGMLSFRLDGDFEATKRMLRKLRLFSLAVSLGGVESLINHPASMTHSEVSPEDRLAVGITDDLLRVSVGIESAKDIVEDFAQALTQD